MFKLIFIYSIFTFVQCDLTSLNDILTVLEKNPKTNYSIGFMSTANKDVVKRYLLGNIDPKLIEDKNDIIKALDEEKIIAAVTTGQDAEGLQERFHVFSSLIISPQAMLLAPDYNEKSTPYGLKNQSSEDLFDALNAAIADVQHDDIDETLLKRTKKTDLVRVYTCHQNTRLPVPNRNETTGILRDILLNNKTLVIGGIGPRDWGEHDGNYRVDPPIGFYPKLLEAIVTKLASLSGPDGVIYSQKINFERRYYNESNLLFKALLDGTVDATDVYLLIDASYDGTHEVCTNNNDCRARESCVQGICTRPARPRSLNFRTTCTTASRDTKFLTKKDSKIFKTSTDNSTNRQTPKTRWIGFLLLFTTLFGSIFIILLIMVRRKQYHRVERTMQGGLGKFARLQEESEPPIEAMDAFDDHIVQSPRDNTNSTS